MGKKVPLNLTVMKQTTKWVSAEKEDVSEKVVMIVLNTEIMSLTMLKEMTAQRRMDVSMRKVRMKASAVLLEVQLMSNVMENVEAGVADALMIVKNKEKATKNVKVR